MPSPTRPAARAAFTFLELVVVISIIAALAAMGFPAWRYYKASADRNATIALVQNIATAITQYPVKTWTWDNNPARPIPFPNPPPVGYMPQMRTAFLWDMNNRGNNPDCPAVPNGPPKYYSLDGEPRPIGFPANPGRYDDSFDASIDRQLIASGYVGFYDMVRPTVANRFVKKNRQIVDAWGNPLRIAFAADTYGSSWFGLWSAGQDRRDDTADDICSWTTTHGQ